MKGILRSMNAGFLTLWLSILVPGAMAQEERLTITLVKSGNEPMAVMDAIKKDFPNAIAKDLAFLPAKLYGREWNLQLTRDTIEVYDFYQIQMKEKDISYIAVYDKGGTLLSAKETIKTSRVPDAVVTAIHQFFYYWTIEEAFEIINTKGTKATVFYKVRLSVDRQHRIVFLDPLGKILSQHISI